VRKVRNADTKMTGASARSDGQKIQDRDGHASDVTHQVKPCSDCPWRKDVPAGNFPPERFVALAHTAYDMSMAQFACHKSREGREFACAGFLLAGAAHNLGVRLGLRAGMVDLAAVSSEVELYPNFRAMAIANGVPADHRALTSCRDDTSAR
jgi:hypothetical protein